MLPKSILLDMVECSIYETGRMADCRLSFSQEGLVVPGWLVMSRVLSDWSWDTQNILSALE